MRVRGRQGPREFHHASPKIIEITQDHNELLSLYHLIESRKQLTGKRRRDRRGSRRDRRAVKKKSIVTIKAKKKRRDVSMVMTTTCEMGNKIEKHPNEN